MLTPEMVLYAYSIGAFPMAHPEDGNQIYWHEPKVRGIIPLDNFYVSRNLQRLVKRNKFEVTINQDFEKVIRACARTGEDETWISEEIIEVYMQLHQLGWAYSFETRLEGELVGGLYGIAMGKAFFGESMFYKVTDASKVALVHLVNYLNEKKFQLLDIQYLNNHTLQFGGKEITRATYRRKLKKALEGISFEAFFS